MGLIRREMARLEQGEGPRLRDAPSPFFFSIAMTKINNRRVAEGPLPAALAKSNSARANYLIDVLGDKLSGTSRPTSNARDRGNRRGRG